LPFQRSFGFCDEVNTPIILKNNCPIGDVISDTSRHFEAAREFEEEFDIIVGFTFEGEGTLNSCAINWDVIE